MWGAGAASASLDDRLKHAPCGWLAFADDGVILQANETLATMLGCDASSLAGRRFESILTLASRIFHQTHFFPLLRMHGHVEEMALALRSAEHGEFPAMVNAVRVSRDGQVHNECVIVTMRSRHRYEQAVRLRQREAEAESLTKTLQLHSMSHELRTPLNAIIGFTRQVLRNRDATLSAKHAHFLGRVEANSVHLLEVINAVLDLSKIQAGKADIVLGRTDVAEVVRHCMEQMEGVPRADGVRLEAQCDVPLQPIDSDATRLRQVLTNLIGNALKFTTRGHVRVRVEGDTDGWPLAITVEDTGEGIAPERLEAIFEPFVQADRTTERRFGGTGLGLTISRALCELMGHELTVTSTLGVGTTFRIAFPPSPVAVVNAALAAGQSIDR